MKKIISPETLTARQLDDYLHRGWFRVGQTLITCRALAIKKRLCSTVWTRTDLRNYALKASLRRVVRKVEERFQITVSPVCLDDEHEALYQRYLTVTDGSRAPTLKSFLFDDEPSRDLFDTWEVTVRDGGTLVAFSFFDLGEESLQSLIGVYEPTLARYGLGIYTMLREVDFGVETGRRFHYAGYVLIGDPRMDYKLRPGGASILDDRSGDWLPWGALAAGHYTPAVERQRAALERARLRLQEAGVPASLRVYMLFELPVHIAELASCITQPLFLDCLPPRGDNQKLLILWDIERESYSLVHALSIQARTKGEDPEDLELFAEIARHPSCAGLDEVIDAILDACR